MTSTHSSFVQLYSRSKPHSATVCSLTPSTRLYVHDAAVWETFAVDDLATYLAEGVAKTSEHIARIQDLTTPYTEQDEQQLVFMIESLLHARHAIDDVRGH